MTHTSHNPEAFSRVLIDRALTESEWDLLNQQQVQFEHHTPTGRADYLLKDDLGRVLCVLEAKREDLDPYDAKEQARGYAENLNAPFVILSNGREHWFWNLQRAEYQDAYRIERLPSQKDLERVRLKNLQPPRELRSEVVSPDYLYRLRPDLKLRGYQINAMEAIADLFDKEGRRKFLLEMATGTGKTLLCAVLIRRFLATRNAERVLFIVDRIELAKQTMEDVSRDAFDYFLDLETGAVKTISVDALEGAKSSLYKGDELIDESSLEAYDMPEWIEDEVELAIRIFSEKQRYVRIPERESQEVYALMKK
ncbi:MAG: DEAD/DEAH box helicase family protein, partial [Nitrospirota bacterium]